MSEKKQMKTSVTLKRLKGLILFCLLAMTLFAQQNPGHQFCHVEDSLIQYTPLPYGTGNSIASFHVKLYLHKILHSDGSGGVTDADLTALMSTVNADFNAHFIYFTYCIIEHRIEESYNSDQLGPNELFQLLDCRDDGINVFILPTDYYEFDNSSFGIHYGGGRTLDPSSFASAVPASYLMIYGHTETCDFPFFPADIPFILVPHALSHELGHCFGLFHPHETFFCIENAGNCQTCGDLLCQTVPSPN